MPCHVATRGLAFTAVAGSNPAQDRARLAFTFEEDLAAAMSQDNRTPSYRSDVGEGAEMSALGSSAFAAGTV